MAIPTALPNVQSCGMSGLAAPEISKVDCTGDSQFFCTASVVAI